jgi:hypothetical protein
VEDELLTGGAHGIGFPEHGGYITVGDRMRFFTNEAKGDVVKNHLPGWVLILRCLSAWSTDDI